MKILELLQQRRIWAGILGVIAFLATTMNLGWGIDVPELTDLLTQWGIALSAFVSASLAVYSYFSPKK